MGNQWSGPHPWPSQRKSVFVEMCHRAPGRFCPKCNRRVRFLLAHAKAGQEPKAEDWQCRFCIGAVYMSQWGKYWQNEAKRDPLERASKLLDELDARAARRVERAQKSRERAQKKRERYLRQQAKQHNTP